MTQDELNRQAVLNLYHLAGEIERGALTVTRISVEVGAFTVAYEEVPEPLPCGHSRSAAVEVTDQDDRARGVRSWVCSECGYAFVEKDEGGYNNEEDG